MKAKAELIKVSRLFYSHGWMPGTSGNLSILISKGEFLITVSGKDKGELTEDDFILVNENGSSASNDKPSAETLLHSTIYQNTDATAVFHIHTINSTLLSNKNINLTFEGLEILKGLGFKTHDVKITIPVIENSQDMKYLSGILPGYINPEVPGLVLKGHGIYAWGKTSSKAKNYLEIFESLFEYRIKELSV